MGLKVKVVDDDDAIRELIITCLSSRGYEVEGFDSAELGWRALLRERPHLLILDVGLPGEDGLALLRRLRSLHGPDAYPVLIVSGRGMEDQILAGYESGANEYLTKPFTREELLAKCAVLIARSAGLSDTTALRKGAERKSQLLFERYEAREVLGQGAFGVVYHAYDLQQERREVALKVSGPEHARDPEQRLRFLRESYALSSLKHPAIVEILDFGLLEDQLYLAMEYVSGPTVLSYVSRRGPISEADALAFLRAMATALAVLSAASLVHRDLKPANIILRGGSARLPVLVDFGLAKREHERSITAKSTIVGTPAFMAPEIFLGEPADTRSDLFSLGLVVRYALTGQVLFPHLQGVPLLMRMARGGIPLPECVDPRLEAALTGLIHSERGRRLASPQALLDLLGYSEAVAS